MIHDSNHDSLGMRFLLAIVISAMVFLIFMGLPLWGLVLVLLGLGWSAGWLTRRIQEQNQVQRRAYAPVVLEVDEQKLERLRELHRIGDG
jgi:hypothetical protein